MPLNIQRLTLTVGQVTPILPPVEAHGVVIGNATADDLRIASQKADLTQYEVLAAGFELDIKTTDHAHLFNTKTIGFYLTAISGGAVTLRWI